MALCTAKSNGIGQGAAVLILTSILSGCTDFQFGGASSAPPDLAISALMYRPEAPTPKNTITINLTILNKGRGPADPSVLVVGAGGSANMDDHLEELEKLLERAGGHIDAGLRREHAGIVGESVAVPKLDPGERFNVSWELGKRPTGTYTATVIADVNDNVAEHDEQNNRRNISFNVHSRIFEFQTQVTNNSGTRINKARIDDVEFVEYINYCGDGCSTDYSALYAGTNQIEKQIEIKTTEDGAWLPLDGTLGPFLVGDFYSVNLRIDSDISFCAELWKRGDTGPIFNEDAGRTFVASNCALSPLLPGETSYSQVINQTGESLNAVWIGEVYYSEDLTCDGETCPSRFMVIKAGANEIKLQATPDVEPLILNASLGQFQVGSVYHAVVVKTGATGFCTELWRLPEMSASIEDSGSVQVVSSCP